MDRLLEDELLQLALAKGLVTRAELDRVGTKSTETGRSRLDLLVEDQRVSRDIVDELLVEAKARKVSSDSEPPASARAEPDPSAPTLSLTGGKRGRDPRTVAFPVKDWDRYRFVRYVGEGAMGRVYEAYDPRLDREVALKFLLGDDPDLVSRFQREAQAQAHVEHEHLCEVFEVGEVQGRHYIAMQLIPGKSLRHTAPEMTLEQKLVLMRQVAEAVHHAHRSGLIHRDLKPSNILVERLESGWKPWVMDFGLARQVDSPGVTVSGALLGTVQYMSPEQARGEIHTLDRRADVYSLGATLYELLAGRPPFTGESRTGVLLQVLNDFPPGLRATNRRIPRDVESVALKCLEKHPDSRYPSARAFAADLGRYLDGEPVQARPVGFFRRLRLRAAKHKLEVATAAIGIVLVLASLGWGLRHRWVAAQRSRLAQEFGQQVESIEALARYSAMAPLHDIRPERQTIRERMHEIEIRMRELGNIATGPGNYALGRGHLAIEAPERALDHLQAAWESGYREPEAAYALGLVMGELYQEKLLEANSIRNKETRAAARLRAQHEYRDPALGYLRAGAGREADYGEALLAFYEERHDEALEEARAAYTGLPWFYEARELEGRIHLALAGEAGDQGDFDAAANFYQRAQSAFDAAREVAPSDPGVYLAMGDLAEQRMISEIGNRGQDVTPAFLTGLRVADLALQANPDDIGARSLQASLYRRMAQYAVSRGEDPREDLERSLAAARAALEIEPEHAKTLGELGATWWTIAKYDRDRGADPTEGFERAIEAYESAIRISPNATNLSRLGLVLKEQARHRMDHGEDPRERLALSVQAYEHALALAPDRVDVLQNLANTYLTHAQYESDIGVSPLDHLDEAVLAFRKALAVNPNHLVVLYNLGSAYNTKANYEHEHGVDPSPTLQSALDAYGAAIEINPQTAYLAYLRDGRGVAFSIRADHARENGEAPEGFFDEADAEFEAAIAFNPRYIFPHGNQGYVNVARAEHCCCLGADPTPFLEEAIRCGERALEINPEFSPALLNLGNAHYLGARHAFDQGTDPGTELASAQQAFRRVLELNPSSGNACVYRGRALVLQARRLAREGADAEPAFREATREIEEGIRIDSNRAFFHTERAEAHWRWAEWRRDLGHPAEAQITEGLSEAERALAINPASCRARALQGVLLLMQAEVEQAPSRKAALLEAAAASLDRALAGNCHLEREFGPHAEKIRAARLRPEGSGIETAAGART